MSKNPSPPPNGGFWFDGSQWVPISASDPLPIAGSISATLAGFTPNGNVASPLSVTTSSSSVGLPAGTTVVVSNIGSNAAFVRLGVGSATATVNDIPVGAGGAIGLTVGSNTVLGAITATGTALLNIAGGSGLFTATAAGTGGGGVTSTVTLAAGVAAIGTVAVSSAPAITGTVSVSNTVAISGTTTIAAGVNNVGTVAVSNFPATQPVSGTVTAVGGPITLGAGTAVVGALVANQSMNVAQVAGATTATGHGTAATALRVELPTDGTGIVGIAAGVNNIGTVAVAGGGLTGTVTLAAGTAAVGTIALSGTSPVSGTVTSNLGTLNGAATAANQTAVAGSATGGTAATSSQLVGGVFNTVLPTLTNTQQGAIQLDASGRQIMGTSAANIGTVALSGTASVTGAITLAAGSNAVGAISESNFPGTQTIGGSVTLAAGAATIGALTANQSVNLNQIAGASPGVGAGTEAAALRVTLPTDGTGHVNTGFALLTNNLDGFISSTATTAATIIAAQSTLSIYVTDLEFSNTSTTAATVTLNNAAATQLYVPATGGREVHLLTPIKIASATPLTFTTTPAVTSILAGAQGFKA